MRRTGGLGRSSRAKRRSPRTKSFAIQMSPSYRRFDFQAFAAAIDGIIFTGGGPLLSIHVSIISFFRFVVIALVTTWTAHNPLTVPPIVKFFTLLVPPQNLKVDFCLVFRSFACCVGVFYLTPCGWAASCLFFLVTLFSSITVYVQSPIIPCTYLLLATSLSPLPYC